MANAGLGFGVLGPLPLTARGVPMPVGPPKQRAVLALLLINRNRPVSVESLIHGVWGGDPVPAARTSIQAHVSNLRRLLRSAGVDSSRVSRARPRVTNSTSPTPTATSVGSSRRRPRAWTPPPGGSTKAVVGPRHAPGATGAPTFHCRYRLVPLLTVTPWNTRNWAGRIAADPGARSATAESTPIRCCASRFRSDGSPSAFVGDVVAGLVEAGCVAILVTCARVAPARDAVPPSPAGHPSALRRGRCRPADAREISSGCLGISGC